MIRELILSFIVLVIYVVYLAYSGLSSPMNEYVFMKDGKQIIFMEMIHVGTYKFYNNLSKKYDSKDNLILVEGVTDKKQLIKRGPKNEMLLRFEYGRKITTCVQPSDNILFPNSKRILGDVDSSELSPETIKFINGFVESTDKKAIKENVIANEFLNKRNKRLLSVLEQNLEHDKIIIPWGKLHFNEVRQGIEKLGYKLVQINANYDNRFGTILKEKIGIVTYNPSKDKRIEAKEYFDQQKSLTLSQSCSGWYMFSGG